MRNTTVFAGLLFLTVVLTRAGHAQTPVPVSDDVRVREVWSKLDRRWSGRDAKGFAALFGEDASFAFVDRGEAMTGRGEILDRFVVQFETQSPVLRHKTTVHRIQPISDNVRAIDGTVRIVRASDGSDRESEVFASFSI